MNDFFIPFGNIFHSLRSKARGMYNWGFNVVNASTQFNSFALDREKLTIVLSNPAVLKVFALQCDLFSMGKVCIQDQNGEEIEEDPFLDLLRSPNPFTKTESQFLWDYMFWNMLGTSYTYVDSSIVDRKNNKMYYLDPSKIDWPQELERKKDKMIFSDAELNSILKTTITYKYDDGTTFKFPMDRLVITHDLTNSIGNFFKGPSRLDALHKIISNSEHTLDSENINIRYTSKFLVGSDMQTGTVNKMGMNQLEKDDLANKIDSMEKNVWPMNTKLNIQRFVSDMGALQLKENYLHQYFLIGNMFNIPRDVLEAYNSATWENQEKARAAHVNYTLEPKGEQFMDGFEVHFGYREQGKKINMSWSHLPFVQVFAKEKAETQTITINNLNSLLALGVKIKHANKYLGTDFEIEKKPDGQGEAQGGQGGPEGSAGDQNETSQGQGADQEVE